MIISCNRNEVVDPLFSKLYLNISKTWLTSTSKELKNAILSFDQIDRSSAPSSLLQTAKINFLTYKHLSNFSSTTYCTFEATFPLPFIVPTFTVPNRLGEFPAGLSPWPEVARTIKFSAIDATFIHYSFIIHFIHKLYFWMSFLTQNPDQPGKFGVFTRATRSN